MYPCGFCGKNLGKSVGAILCKNNCLKWYHISCTKLTKSDIKEIKKSNMEWSCNKCMTHNIASNSQEDDQESITDSETTETEIEINNAIREQLQSSDFLIKTLNNDLIKANQEIKQLMDDKNQLQNLLLIKEEEIVKMEMKLKEITQRSEETFATVTKKNLKCQRNSLSTVHSASWLSPLKSKAQTKKSNCVKLYNENKIVTKNRFDVLSAKDESHKECVDDQELKTSKQKILICGDSHGKDLAWYIDSLESSVESIGFIKPGGRTKQVLDMENINAEHLTEKDFLVIVSGTNDVAKNESHEVVSSITETLTQVKNKNVILVDLPNRFDLVDWSCVNTETRKTNYKLQELCAMYKNITIVEASSAERDMHTKHGLHLNIKGKKWLAQKIIDTVKNYTNRPSAQHFSPSGGDHLPRNEVRPTDGGLPGNDLLTSADRPPILSNSSTVIL